MIRTKTEAAMAAAEQAHEDDPERAEVLHRARRFKTSWIELAEALTEVRRNAHWKRWGHASFEAYAKTELHLRQETVDKLTGSFLFLQKRAPEVLERDGVSAPIPSYQSVDYLRRAESQEGAPGEVVEAIRKRVIEEAAPLPTIARQYNETVFPIDAGTRSKRDLAGIKNVAKRLRDLLGESSAVPRKLAGDVSTAIERLLAAIEADESKEESAA
jgi:hypothetical protein